MNKSEENRYNLSGYRNYKNYWKIFSGVETEQNKTILDFGCGSGIESLQFARNGNRIILADINSYNIKVATRLLRLNGFEPLEQILVNGDYPFFTNFKNKIDIFYSAGVLHHTPYIREIISRGLEQLNSNGLVRLMLYSDKGYLKYINSQLPDIHEDIVLSAHFVKMYKHFDSVGKYADWYSEEKLDYRLNGLCKIVKFNYITDDSRFLFADLTPIKSI
jgi:SAM-dependent methyltransferase